MDTSLSDLGLSPLQELMREASKKSELVHRNHDLTDSPYFEDGDPIFNEPLLPTTLCDVCQSIYFVPTSKLTEDEYQKARLGYPEQTDWAFNRLLFYFHQPSLEALSESSKNGCHCCILIWKNCFANQGFSHSQMTASDPIILDHSLGMKELSWSGNWFPGNGNYMGIRYAGKAYGWAQLRFLQIPNPMTRILQDNANPSSSVLENLRLAKKWLATCWINHPKCLQFKIPPMPTRVIDVGTPNGSRSPRLCTPRVRARYLTLSHCWGPHQIITTTSRNYDAHCKGITMESLSKTFQDAINVTRQFGMRYIWIDSLCIIQDSAADWAKESARMCAVYKNALFTIAASRAKSGKDGLFSLETPILHTPCLLPQYGFATKGGAQVHIHLTRDPEPTDVGFLKNDLKGPLYDRAWVLQEEKLSHATLAFTETGMTWECSYSMVTSQDPEGMDDNLRHDHLKYAIKLGERHSRMPSVLRKEKEDFKAKNPTYDETLLRTQFTSKRTNIYQEWCETVELYFLRKITHPGDRLPALSGLAEATKEVLSDRFSQEKYVAGIWLYDLARQLVWTTTISHFHSRKHVHLYEKRALGSPLSKRRTRPPELYKAPTWSWASLHETPVSWGMHFWGDWAGDWIKLVLAKTQWTPSTLNPYGNLLSAELCVEGMLLSVFAIGQDDPYLYDITPELLRETPEGEEPPPFVKIGKLVLDEEKSLEGMRDGEMGGAIVELLPVISSERGNEMRGFRWKITCLVLVKSGLGDGKFRRVGLGLVSDLGYFHDVDMREVVII
ncbi:heterokaryon incompatibility protein-domain-containing protein [Cadophora sp. MPI-SDFR-AT-0126]|nr:heterokaryon incompatibility protein-domain-containing protein [Leotiomycetes sp. MPI-SDFR-AT-0126]